MYEYNRKYYIIQRASWKDADEIIMGELANVTTVVIHQGDIYMIQVIVIFLVLSLKSLYGKK